MKPDTPTVFVIDDDPLIRDGVRSLIASVGLRVLTFGSARDFLRSTRPDGPACLVLDVRLPDLSGLDLQRELRALDIHIPIIFITGHGDIPMTVEAMKAGAAEFLTKPCQELLEAVQGAIDSRTLENSLDTTRWCALACPSATLTAGRSSR